MNHILAAATLALILGAPGFANAQSDDAFLDKPCRDLIDAGWSKMPDVASYVMSKPGASNSAMAANAISACSYADYASAWLETRLPKASDCQPLRLRQPCPTNGRAAERRCGACTVQRRRL